MGTLPRLRALLSKPFQLGFGAGEIEHEQNKGGSACDAPGYFLAGCPLRLDPNMAPREGVARVYLYANESGRAAALCVGVMK